jgi:hypothetical protein
MTQAPERITKEQFLAFEKVRRSGKTNMFDVQKVIAIAGGKLTKTGCLEIMKNYASYKAQFLKKQ